MMWGKGYPNKNEDELRSDVRNPRRLLSETAGLLSNGDNLQIGSAKLVGCVH